MTTRARERLGCLSLQLEMPGGDEDSKMEFLPLQGYVGGFRSRRRTFDADCIIPGYLWLGSVKAANDVAALEEHGIKRVLTLCEADLFGEVTKGENLAYHSINLHDVASQEIRDAAHAASELVCQGDGNAPLLIHCVAGISRSPSLCIAFLLEKLGICLCHAYGWVANRRPGIRPNEGFREQFNDMVKSQNTTCSDLGIPTEWLAETMLEDLTKRACSGEVFDSCAFCDHLSNSPAVTPCSSHALCQVLHAPGGPPTHPPKNRPNLRVAVPKDFSEPSFVTPVTLLCSDQVLPGGW
eukprot:CAMPEP_0175911418 /NCGR_PEP_ID=MMETSP0108-20121206/8183_1 /TAXON_ID=195067 ORGANISM="Goniomonas pacifica, Strain CCMP1869" /NCGR_SAMPLE_ID=MMETSP0108 /ASSEMBLY_ACC=CAM_ASM_000204 /LENGTH=295 /DNA_ID=CAMNT_0017233663 /DNA_START=15 /DNA_END=902 /DNA_ORIENTATION=-